MVNKVVILVGACGEVGKGILESFYIPRYDRWEVIAIDPNISKYNNTKKIKLINERFEDLPDEQILPWLQNFSKVEICYTAEIGNRDLYSQEANLGKDNCERFRSFMTRLEKLVNKKRGKIHISYCGGSWTRRASLKDNDNVLLVSNCSPTKEKGGDNLYEQSKTIACKNAQDLSLEHKDWCDGITFYDYISVVPNYSPNFTIHKMVKEALEQNKITYSDGDYGRPLLHSNQAGDIIRSLAERETCNKFEIILIPGCFTKFETFAEITKQVVENYKTRVRKIELQHQQNPTPNYLRSRCSSQKLLEQIPTFVPNGDLVQEGLRETALKALEYYLDKELI